MWNINKLILYISLISNINYRSNVKHRPKNDDTLDEAKFMTLLNCSVAILYYIK